MKLNKPFVKIIILLLVMVFLSLFIGKALTQIVPKKADTEAIRFRKQASAILDKLVNSESCLAASSGEKTINLKTLEDFQTKYFDIQPDCARDYEYSYNIEVETSDNRWYFGPTDHSEYDALQGSVVLSTSVMIRDDGEVKSGKMTIRLYKGELEELVGMIDKTCDTDVEISKNIHFSYPVEFRGNNVCMKDIVEFCRRIVCEKVNFKGINIPGNYTIISKKEWGGDIVIVEAAAE